MRPSLIALVLIIITSCHQEEKNTSSIAGVYTLISWEGIKNDGSIAYPYGKAADGQLIYDAQGNMSMHLEAGDRAKLGTDDYELLDSLSVLNAYKSYFSYYGTYELDANQGTVQHNIEGCKNPDWKGRILTRKYNFEKGNLIIRSDSVIGMDHILTWRRLSSD